MLDPFSRKLEDCSGLQSILDCLLGYSLVLTGAARGNVQTMDWETGILKIGAHEGLADDFLETFAMVGMEDGSSCGRAIRERRQVVIEDVRLDSAYGPYVKLAERSGFCAVQSTPLISHNDALVGVVSTHFSVPHRPSEHTLHEMQRAGELCANAIIRDKVERTSPRRTRTWFDAGRQDGETPRVRPSSLAPQTERWSRAYLAVLVPIAEGRWHAELPDFPGSDSEAPTPRLALDAATRAAQLLALELIELGHAWSEPRSIAEIQQNPLWSISRAIWRKAIISYVSIVF